MSVEEGEENIITQPRVSFDEKKKPDPSFDICKFVEAQYIDSFYRGKGTGPPPGDKKYKSKDELKPPPAGRLLGDGPPAQKSYKLLRLLLTLFVGLVVIGGLAVAYGINLVLVKDKDGRLAFSLYGLAVCSFLLFQSFIAGCEARKTRANPPPADYATSAASKIVVQISAYKEDPDYFRICLKSVMELNYPADKLKVVCCVDGNTDDDVYMVDIFEQVVREYGQTATFFWWDYNLHELPDDIDDKHAGVTALRNCIQDNQFICILQKWGGKREVMYSVFKNLAHIDVDYVQVCDSDTKLHPDAMLELAWVLDSNPNTGAVGGDVKILNDGDSLLSFLTSLRYWMAFNIERAAQSYFGCVGCISGPLGLYRVSVVSDIVDLWSDQTFLGTHCTFGDDRHLTNRILQLGSATRYTSRSICWTETPSVYSRWLAQQLRWTKSYFREWLFNAMWWHKHHIWMTFESIIAGCFPFFIMATLIMGTWSGDLWQVLLLLLVIQVVGVVKGIMAWILSGRFAMVLMSLYAPLYVTSLLPTKVFAILTITRRGWGTSGRKTLLTSYHALIPPFVWGLVLISGFVYTATINDYSRNHEAWYLTIGAITYAFLWLSMLVIFRTCLRQYLKSKEYWKKHVTDRSQNDGFVDFTDTTTRENENDIEIATTVGSDDQERTLVPASPYHDGSKGHLLLHKDFLWMGVETVFQTNRQVECIVT